MHTQEGLHRVSECEDCKQIPWDKVKKHLNKNIKIASLVDLLSEEESDQLLSIIADISPDQISVLARIFVSSFESERMPTVEQLQEYGSAFGTVISTILGEFTNPKNNQD